MLISSTYICPVRGLAGLEPPEPHRLGRAAAVAKSLGLERFLLPVLEEALVGSARARVAYLDGIIQALDGICDSGLSAWLDAPAQRILGLDWAPPHLVKAVRDPRAGPVFVDGRVRRLWPFEWWADPSLIQKRIKIFRELVAAVHGHPALTGWLILDRALEWARPDPEVADLVLRSYLAEIRERDEGTSICMGLGCSEILDPEMAQGLAGQVNGLRIGGLEDGLRDLNKPTDLAAELSMATFLGTLAQWLFERPVELEIGWGLAVRADDTEGAVEAGKQLAYQGLNGVSWLSLTDPDPRLCSQPPWETRPGLEKVGLLDRGMEPKHWVETWIGEVRSAKPRDGATDFIDVSPEEYIADPQVHLPRLWDHFRESF